ncbi:MAG: lamin tail domain-containing protein [Planctomycetes bacterium]|nr:lamin tail domain-containing protein [Planctomycetota bacterium]
MTIATARRIAALILTACFLVAPAHAQDVHLSEVHTAPNAQWIEVHNRGPVAQNLSNWSLHCATTTNWMPNNYWWPFPAGTTLAPGAYLRVHWYQDAPAAPAPGDLYTGTSPWGFLFGLGGEMLSGNEGAAALFSSQSNAQMSSSSSVVDWVSWGTSGFQREGLAAAAGLWTLGRATPPIPIGSSLARDPDAIGTTTFQDQSWFIDSTPTPGMPNVTGAVVQSYGSACTMPGNHLLGLPVLRATALPVYGNEDFGFAVDHTTGIFGEYVLVGFSAAAAPPGQTSILPGYGGGGCLEVISTPDLVLTTLVPATILSTQLPMPLNGYPPQVIGLEMHVQAVVLELLPSVSPPYQGISNALRVVVGQ